MARTIIQAIKEVMQAERRPMTASEVYDAIVSADLYTFNADKPVHVVHTQVRRHAKGLDFPSASDTKYFELFESGRYYLLGSDHEVKSQALSVAKSSVRRGTLTSIKTLHNEYLDEFKSRTLKEIKKIDPTKFEQFCRNLLSAYGFRDVVVTRPVKDGGVDGHGRLEVGVAHLNVAFQCKRRTKGRVGRLEIDQFRGATQGQYEQGYFFTTADFSPEAKENSFKPGAVPIILIDGMSIIDIMIDKQFGVETEQLSVHTLALDLALSNDS